MSDLFYKRIKDILHSNKLLYDVVNNAKDFHLVKRSHKTEIYIIIVNDTEFILKSYLKSRYALKEYIAIKKYVASTSLKLPEIISYQIETIPAFILFKKIKGRELNLMDKKEVVKLIPNVIKIVSNYDLIKFPHYGEIVGEYEPSPNTNDFKVYLFRLIKFWVSNIEKKLYKFSKFSKFLKKQIENIYNKLDRVPSVLSVSPTFTHSDLRLENILYTKDGLVIVDYDNSFSFVREFDLCKLFIDIKLNNIPYAFHKFINDILTYYNVNTQLAYESLSFYFNVVFLRLLNYYVNYNKIEQVDNICTLYSSYSSIINY